MASLATHFSTFLFLFPIGLRRLHTSLSLYLKNPSLYCSKPWSFSEPRWKSFDLYALFIALPVASFSLLFLFLSLSGDPTHRFAFLKQSLIVFLFWVLLILILVREIYDILSIPDDFIFVFGCVLFIIEFTIMGKSGIGLIGEVDRLLGQLTLVCAFSCLYLSVRPSSFFAEFFLSSGVIFKGTWALQIGLSLFTDTFGLKGCGKVWMAPDNEGKSDIKCDLEDNRFRAIALMNLLFIVHAIFVLIVSFGMYALLCYNRNLRSNEASGALLAGLENETMQIRSLPEYDFD